MVKSNSEEFGKLWTQFTTKLKGRIIRENTRQTVTFELLQTILDDTKNCWDSPYEACGRWLRNLMATDENKAKKVRTILLTNMKFQKAEQAKLWLRYLVYLLPVLFGVGGYFVSSFFSANWIVNVASSAVPALIMLLSARLLEKNLKTKQDKKFQSNYLEQLDIYRIQIADILDK